MEKLQFSITIEASKERVWKVLWDDSTYRRWTSAFCEGSYAVSDWKEGSKVLFLSPAGEGLVSTIEANRPGEFMSFRHAGMVKNFVEDNESQAVKEWAGAMENYSLTEDKGITTLLVELDITEEFKAYFHETWPKALEQLKQLAENA